MKRKIVLALLAALCIAACAFGLVACTEPNQPKPDDGSDKTPPNYTPPASEDTELFTFQLNEDKSGYVVTGLAEGVTNTNITIPATYNNLPVVEIGERAFGSCSNLTSVTITSGIKVIGSGAFTDCSNLPTFKFPDSITTISDSAFQNCSGLRALHFNATSKLATIDANAFQNCAKLAAVTLPDSVETIGNRAFQGCSALKSITIGNGVQTIGDETFRGCTALKTVNVGNGLKQLGEKTFINCTEITELVLPNSLERVGLGALQGCTGIKKLSLPFVGSEKYTTPIPADKEYSTDNHTNFGYIFGAGSFHDHASLILDNLETVIITGDSPIGYHAFQGIGRFVDSTETEGIGLSSLIITGNVKVIGEGAFQGCFNLQTLVIPKSVTTIGRQILEVGVIQHVYYCGTATDWSKLGTNSSNNMGLYETATQKDPKYFYSENEPTASGQYWHYVDGVPTPWKK